MILDRNTTTRRIFNVSKKADVDVFRNFMLNSGWGAGGCPFELEYPYLSVPDMIKDKLLRKALKLPTLPINSMTPTKGDTLC
jgi:hypothetical protein